MPSTISTTTRRTGTIAKVIDDNLNSWEDFAGADINVDVAYSNSLFGSLGEEYQQGHWAYRGQAAVCKRTTDNAIVRVRIGDGTVGDWKVYRQIITDPTNVAQWTTWSSLYTGANNYAVAIEPDASAGAGYRVFTAKSDGLYVDNTLKIAQTGIVRIKPTAFDVGRIYFQTVEQDAGDSERTLRWWYTANVNATTPVVFEDCANYRWYRHDLVALKGVANNYFRFRSMAHEAGSRNKYASESLTVEQVSGTTDTVFNQWRNVRYLKASSKQQGYTTISNLYITSLYSSPFTGAYNLFYNERHFDTVGNVLSNLRNPLFWSRSIGFPYYMSAPTPVGYSIWGFSGAIEWGDYIYLCGNGRVLRRYKLAVETDLTNYVLEGSYEIPRDNQKSSGVLVCANPDNVLGAQLGLTDADESGLTERRVEFGIGQKSGADITYEWLRDEAWWISKLRKIQEGADNPVQRLEIEIGNFWHRLENPFRDTVTQNGNFVWKDWQPDASNELKLYDNDTDEFQRSSPAGFDTRFLPHLRTIHSGDGDIPGLGGTSITRFAGWRGENGLVSALFWEDGGLVFRYQDVDNFFIVKATAGGLLKLIRYQDGDARELASTPLGSATVGYVLQVDFRWKRIKVFSIGGVLIDHVLTDPATFTGFVGFTSPEISNFNLQEWNAPINRYEMVRIMLAYADEHEIEVEQEVIDEAAVTTDDDAAASATSNMNMGPQYDLDTPEKVLRQELEASRLQILWRQD